MKFIKADIIFLVTFFILIIIIMVLKIEKTYCMYSSVIVITSYFLGKKYGCKKEDIEK